MVLIALLFAAIFPQRFRWLPPTYTFQRLLAAIAAMRVGEMHFSQQIKLQMKEMS